MSRRWTGRCSGKAKERVAAAGVGLVHTATRDLTRHRVSEAERCWFSGGDNWPNRGFPISRCFPPPVWTAQTGPVLQFGAGNQPDMRARPSAISHKPSGPSATTRRRQSRHVCRFTPSSSAMAKSPYPWCASNTMRQRVTTCWGVPCARTHVSSSFSCSDLHHAASKPHGNRYV
jgi:hypothetical protein